jgi:hypothetical protein
MSPEYLHVVLNHLPIFGLLVGAPLLLAALIRDSKELRIAALCVIALTALSAWPVSELGDGAKDRAQALADSAGAQWLKIHEHRADKALPGVYATVVFAIGALLASWKKPLLEKKLTYLTLLLTLLSIGLLGWISKAGGQIRHPEFRSGPP